MASVDEKLIEIMKMHTHLYDTSSRFHRDGVMRENSWRSIAEELEISVVDAQRRWKNLRDRFTRERRLLTRKQNESDMPFLVCKWPLYEAMCFFSQYCMPRKKLKSLEASGENDASDVESSSTSAEVTSHDLLSGSSTPSPSAFPLEARPPSQCSRGAKRKPRTSDLNSNGVTLDLDILREMRRCEDESEIFGRHVAATLRSLPRHKGALAKLKIQQVLYEVEVTDL